MSYFLLLSTQCNSIDWSLQAHLAWVVYEFWAENAEDTTRINKVLNLVDLQTKREAALSKTVQLTLYIGSLARPFENFAISNYSLKNLGWKTEEY